MASKAVRAGVVLVALGVAITSALAPPSVADDRPATLTIVATTQSLGALEPCNCVEGMLGGYPRRISAIKRLKESAKAVLVVDGGDLTGKQSHPELLAHKTRAAFDLLRAAGTQAVAVGERDLRLGIEKLGRLARDAKVKLLAANVWVGEEGTGTRPFGSHVVLSVGGVKAVVIGVLDPELGDPSGEVTLSDPSKAISALTLPAGLRIVLFHGSAEAAREQLADVKGIDVIICGHDQTRAQSLAKLGDAQLVEALRDARTLARLDLDLSVKGASLSQVPLDGFVPDDPKARGRVDHYYREVKGLPEKKREPTPGGEFVGAQTCGAVECHPAQYQIFKNTAHHGSFAKVFKKDPKRAKLSECVECHVTGYRYETGFMSEAETPGLAEVGCESCHGVGGNHAARGSGRGYGLREGFPESWKPVCVSCHDPSNSPNFDFDTWLKKIKHWKDREPAKD
jgi:hypothetical protein